MEQNRKYSFYEDNDDAKAVPSTNRNKPLLDKLKGGLFGVAIGDALGGTTEFMSEEEIKETYGKVTEIIGGGVWNLKPGEVTDDTQMTIALVKGIIANPKHPIDSIGKEFLKWYATNPKDVGNIISEVLSQYKGDWFRTAEEVHYQLGEMSAGNGSLMRCLPIALAYEELHKVLKYSILQSKITHFDEKASEACVIYNKIAYRLLHDETMTSAIEAEIQNTVYEPVITEKPEVPADGYVVHTFQWVLYYLYQFHDFSEVAIEATNKGGDSDTIAAIACGLKGVEVGYDKLPKEYKNKILVKVQLDELASKLFLLRLINQ